MSSLHYPDLALLLLVYVALVPAVDAVGVGRRRLAGQEGERVAAARRRDRLAGRWTVVD